METDSATLSTKDAIDFCRSCGGALDQVPLPGCKKPQNHPQDEE